MSGATKAGAPCLPDGWEEVSIGAVTTLVYRYPTYYGIEYVEEGVPEVRGELLLDNGEIENDKAKFRFVSESTAKKFPKVRLEPGDLVMSVRGTMGKIGLATEHTKGAVITANLIRLAPARALIFPEFFRWALLAPNFAKALDAASPQTTIKTITAPGLKELKLRLPRDITEQQKIVQVLVVVRRVLETQKRLLKGTIELKNALLRHFFSHGFHGGNQKQTEVGQIAESWKIMKIGALGKVVTGNTPKTKVWEYYLPMEVDFIAPADLGKTRDIYDSAKKISQLGLATVRQLPAKAIMCVCIGSSIGKVGMTTKLVSATNQQINSIISDEDHDPHFLYYLLSYLSEYWRGFATFGPVPILSKGSFENVNVAVPPTKDEEIEISLCLKALDTKAELYGRRIELFAQLFRTLLHQLMTGLIRVHDLDLSDFESAVAA
jgi:type I restriction enzyme, S subunit